MQRMIIISLLSLLVGMSAGCSDYMDIVPDNVAEIDQAFRLRSTAERFLFTCYSYMPEHGDIGRNPAFFAGDEFWLPPSISSGGAAQTAQIARGNQRVVDPYMNFWEGRNRGSDLYEGIRQTNIFLENIGDVPDMAEPEKRRWIAEAKFLKAYYHFWLVRMYGPIILVPENLPISSSRDEVDKPRSSVDSSFAYIEQLLDEAAADLPERVNEISEAGRITRSIALGVKAKVLVTAASPLFNGNSDYVGFEGPDGNELFNTDFDMAKWEKAVEAAKEAIELTESLGYELYQFESGSFSQFELSDTTLIKMSIRNSVAEKWNSEIIWGNTNSMARRTQIFSTVRGLDPERVGNGTPRGILGPPLKIAEMFYSENGVPIQEDKTWNYSGRFDLQVASAEHRYNLKEGYTTAALNFDREPRFYASLAFDGGIWYGQGRFDDDGDLFFISSKSGQPAAVINVNSYSVTGYWPKKLVHYDNVIGTGSTYTIEDYPWPVLRLADLYLLYAEALNEVEGPAPEVHEYLNKVRARAGLPGVEEAWINYSSNPDKYTTKEGMREIIHHERLIELAFEGKRFWDLRRWKEATEELNKPITGWDLDQETAEGYYRERLIFDQRFSSRDYLWPLSEDVLLSNTQTVQNPGW